MGRVVDVKGKQNVIDRYRFYTRSRKSDAPLFWSLWAQNKLKFASEEADEAEAENEFVTLMEQYEATGTRGEMEVRFHEIEPDTSATNKTPYTASFIFKLFTDDDRQRIEPYNGTGQQQQQPAASDPMSQFLNQYQTFLAIHNMFTPAATVGSDVGEKTIWDRIEGLLTVPIVEQAVSGIAKKVFDVDLDLSGYQTESVMAGDTTTPDVVTELTETDEDRLRAALSILMHNEPDFVGMMEKLAKLKQNNPSSYAMAKTFLK